MMAGASQAVRAPESHAETMGSIVPGRMRGFPARQAIATAAVPHLLLSQSCELAETLCLRTTGRDVIDPAAGGKERDGDPEDQGRRKADSDSDRLARRRQAGGDSETPRPIAVGLPCHCRAKCGSRCFGKETTEFGRGMDRSTRTLQLHHGGTELAEGYVLDSPRDEQNEVRNFPRPFQAGPDRLFPLICCDLCALRVFVVKNPGSISDRDSPIENHRLRRRVRRRPGRSPPRGRGGSALRSPSARGPGPPARSPRARRLWTGRQ